MVVEVRSLRKRRYLFAFLITAAIFLIGMLVGYSFNIQKENSLNEVMSNQRMDYDSLQLQYAFIDVMKNNGMCDGISETLSKSVSDLEELRVRIENYNKDDRFSMVDYQNLKRDYLLAQIKYWLLDKQSKEICRRDSVSILYFYTNECADCETQSYVLTYLKELFGERLLVFSIDSEFKEEPLVDILLKTYGVNEFPTLVIEEKSHSGLLESDGLKEEVCSYFKDSVEQCK
ncbi:MAG: conjugal transfer protein TraF [Candidatus Nanoarchaeia archaeon]|nr:conjugal transfer protein TraF [Candidatus Nanoarchaeia archaeon]